MTARVDREPPPEPPVVRDPSRLTARAAEKFRRFRRRCAAKLIFFDLAETVRTEERQAWLYGHGRLWTNPNDSRGGPNGLGPVVTNCDGKVRRSRHQSGEAFDIVPVWQGARCYPPLRDGRGAIHPFWAVVKTAAEAVGLRWGGSFKIADGPHLEDDGTEIEQEESSMKNRTAPFVGVLLAAVALVGLAACDTSPSQPKEADPHPVAFVAIDATSRAPLPFVEIQATFEAPGSVSFFTLQSPEGWTEKKNVYQDDEPRTCEVVARAVGLPLQYEVFRGTVTLERAKYPGEQAVIRVGEVVLSRAPLPAAGGAR